MSALATHDVAHHYDTFMHRAMCHPVLTAAEEVGLAKRIEQGDKAARERMIECNLRLVSSIVKPLAACGVPFSDLMQEGTVGLMQAVDRFDYRRGWKFSTFAVWLIRRAVLDAVAGGRVIRVPLKAGQHLAAVRRAEAELSRLGPGAASDESIAERTGLSSAVVSSLRQCAQVTVSLDAPSDVESPSLSDRIADQAIPDAADRMMVAEGVRELEEMLRLLPTRHRDVLVQRYGLGGRSVSSPREIGSALGLGEERVRQLEHEGLRRLRSIAETRALTGSVGRTGLAHPGQRSPTSSGLTPGRS